MAYWCGNCINTAHELDRVSQRYAGTGIQVIAVDVDPSSSPGALSEWIKEAGSPKLTFSIDDHGTTALAYKIASLDTVIVIDRSGRIAYRATYPPAEELSSAFARVVA